MLIQAKFILFSQLWSNPKTSQKSFLEVIKTHGTNNQPPRIRKEDTPNLSDFFNFFLIKKEKKEKPLEGLEQCD